MTPERIETDKERTNVPAWQMAMTSGGHRSIDDPAAYASKPNGALDEATAVDNAEIKERITSSKRALG